ncbi:hypothetical protein Cgig2_015499 [Carnegiea gigantea]|uniref:Uncharacterized protein n=1 Tax=Carnegiea gigantea TaxID=171969 RepID=A0A9Q1KG06_9CARY|nr:hypothetical protein Cgig2_015499 [Carnegiea gigantea]
MHLEANMNTKEGVLIRTVEQKLICFQFHNEKDQEKALFRDEAQQGATDQELKLALKNSNDSRQRQPIALNLRDTQRRHQGKGDACDARAADEGSVFPSSSSNRAFACRSTRPQRETCKNTITGGARVHAPPPPHDYMDQFPRLSLWPIYVVVAFIIEKSA